jgi:hypothetical protein
MGYDKKKQERKQSSTTKRHCSDHTVKSPENTSPLSLIYRRTTAGWRVFTSTDVRWEGDENNGRPEEKRTLEGRN